MTTADAADATDAADTAGAKPVVVHANVDIGVRGDTKLSSMKADFSVTSQPNNSITDIDDMYQIDSNNVYNGYDAASDSAVQSSKASQRSSAVGGAAEGD